MSRRITYLESVDKVRF